MTLIQIQSHNRNARHYTRFHEKLQSIATKEEGRRCWYQNLKKLETEKHTNSDSTIYLKLRITTDGMQKSGSHRKQVHFEIWWRKLKVNERFVFSPSLQIKQKICSSDLVFR